MEDYQFGLSKNIFDGTKEILSYPRSNLLILRFEDGTKISIRPSGTEPKIKFYFSVKVPFKNTENYLQVKDYLWKKIQRLFLEIKNYLLLNRKKNHGREYFRESF